MSEGKNTWIGISGRLDAAGEKISELEDIEKKLSETHG